MSAPGSAKDTPPAPLFTLQSSSQPYHIDVVYRHCRRVPIPSLKNSPDLPRFPFETKVSEIPHGVYRCEGWDTMECPLREFHQPRGHAGCGLLIYVGCPSDEMRADGGYWGNHTHYVAHQIPYNKHLFYALSATESGWPSYYGVEMNLLDFAWQVYLDEYELVADFSKDDPFSALAENVLSQGPF